ncbi:MAG: glycosyltransferase [Bacteroidales bacterium]|nr:glycosyltransferase [Bacteroidales bacterium]
MNILFVLRYLNAGGVEIVTSVLANKFVKEGHTVGIFAFEKRTGRLQEKLNPTIPVTVGGKYAVNINNIKLLRKLLIDRNIDIIINQWGLPLIPIITINKARKNLKIKLISVYHNDPLFNGRIQKIQEKMSSSQNSLRRGILSLQLKIAHLVTSFSMRYNYNHCDCYEVLSPSYIQHFISFTGVEDTTKLIAQANPIAFGADSYVYEGSNKKNNLIYVGRIDSIQKMVRRVVDTWFLLESDYPDWHLTIVGDGPELDSLKQYTKEKELNNVSFTGFVDPRRYYEQGTFLLLTSSFEGLPLVVPEAMSYGVIPCCYASFSSVYDMIDDGNNGILVTCEKSGYNPSVMASRLRDVMDHKERRDVMANNAIRKSKSFSIDNIYTQWNKVMTTLLSC